MLGVICMKYVIIGGDAAGMSAAMQLLKHGQEADITILEKNDFYSYAQCGMPYAISGVVPSVDDLVLRNADVYRDKFGMDARVRHEVEKVDTEEKIVIGRKTDTGEEFREPYDKLLIASGAHPFVPSFPGDDVAGVYSLKTIPDTNAIIEDVQAGIEDVTIVGGGYISIEVAEAFRMLGKNVRLLVRGTQLAKIFDEEISDKITEEATKQHIDVLFEEEIEEIIGEEAVTAVRTNKKTYETDMIMIATGVRPNTAFLDHSNIMLEKNGAVAVNEWQETNIADVYAAGDCAMQYHRIKEKPAYVPLGTHANKQGRIAGMNLAGKKRSYKGMTGTSIMKFMDLSLGKTGLSDTEASAEKIPYDSVTIEATNHANYYPNAKKLTIKLTFHKESGKLLGGQVIGESGVGKRSDVLATALFNEMTVEDLEDLDLSYAPPFNSAWDPVQRAARKAVEKLTESS